MQSGDFCYKKALASSSDRSCSLNCMNNLSLNLVQNIYPEMPYTSFAPLNLCLPNRISVVIIGQDPYHGNGQANGLGFFCECMVFLFRLPYEIFF